MSTHVYRREGGEKKVRNSVYVECERPLNELQAKGSTGTVRLAPGRILTYSDS